VRQQDAYTTNAGMQLKLCATSLSKGSISVGHCTPLSTIYSTQGIENDVSARLQNITSVSCDLELWPSDTKVDRSRPCVRGRFMPICNEIGSFVFEVERSQVGNRRARDCREVTLSFMDTLIALTYLFTYLDERTNGQTNGWRTRSRTLCVRPV